MGVLMLLIGSFPSQGKALSSRRCRTVRVYSGSQEDSRILSHCVATDSKVCW